MIYKLSLLLILIFHGPMEFYTKVETEVDPTLKTYVEEYYEEVVKVLPSKCADSVKYVKIDNDIPQLGVTYLGLPEVEVLIRPTSLTKMTVYHELTHAIYRIRDHAEEEFHIMNAAPFVDANENEVKALIRYIRKKRRC